MAEAKLQEEAGGCSTSLGGVLASDLFACPHEECDAVLSKERRLQNPLSVHMGEMAQLGDQDGCGKRFHRRSSLQMPKLQQGDARLNSCLDADCKSAFVPENHLPKHCRAQHGAEKSFQVVPAGGKELMRWGVGAPVLQAGLSSHLETPVVLGWLLPAQFSISAPADPPQCPLLGYWCPKPDCGTVLPTWTERQKHLQQHPVRSTSPSCVRSSSRSQAACGSTSPSAAGRSGRCRSPGGCAPKLTARPLHHRLQPGEPHPDGASEAAEISLLLRWLQEGLRHAGESLIRHLTVHDPTKEKLKPQRCWPSRKSQQRLGTQRQVLVEENLSPLFSQKLYVRLKRSRLGFPAGENGPGPLAAPACQGQAGERPVGALQRAPLPPRCGARGEPQRPLPAATGPQEVA
ncbi:unnamed protein product [Lepidochelys kempii]